MKKEMKVVELNAPTYYERGVQYGEQAREEIDISVAFYKKKFGDFPGWEKITDFAKQFVEASKAFFPEAVEEMQGIADGSGHILEEIMVVNARYEISNFDWKPECSTGVYRNKTTGKNYIFKNCDLGPEVKKHLVILHVVRPDGFRAVGITEAGQLVRDGYNNCGLGMVNSAMLEVTDHAGIAVPGTVVRKKVWESKTFDEAAEITRNVFRTTSTNMLLADKSGNATDFECFPGGTDEVTCECDMIGTGNRFTVHPEKNRGRLILDGIDRGLRLKELMSEAGDTIDEFKLMEILKDEKGYPQSINSKMSTSWETVYSIIVNMTDDKVYICLGRPSEGEYKEYPL
ncbi:MAG: hypothetical protein IKE36_10545 [Solobacterium sp.]|nr:hypothetical protein [Solobacterium sp.]